MYSKIKRLRSGGERKADRDISADAGIVGHINVFTQASEVIAVVYPGGGSGRQEPMLPLLYKARVITMHGDKMLFQGWERPGCYDQPDTDKNKQEWSVRVMVDQPEVTPPSERMA